MRICGIFHLGIFYWCANYATMEYSTVARWNQVHGVDMCYAQPFWAWSHDTTMTSIVEEVMWGWPGNLTPAILVWRLSQPMSRQPGFGSSEASWSQPTTQKHEYINLTQLAMFKSRFSFYILGMLMLCHARQCLVAHDCYWLLEDVAVAAAGQNSVVVSSARNRSSHCTAASSRPHQLRWVPRPAPAPPRPRLSLVIVYSQQQRLFHSHQL